MAVGHIERLAGVAYDWPQILEQTIPFLADHGGLAGHEICTSLVALVLARMGGRWLTMARSFLGHGCRHPERMLRMFAASEGSLLIGVNTAT